jgi:hypothetical protein
MWTWIRQRWRASEFPIECRCLLVFSVTEQGNALRSRSSLVGVKPIARKHSSRAHSR